MSTTGNDPGRRRVLTACCGAHVLHDGLVDLLYAMLPVLAQGLGLNYAQVGMIRAANKAATASLQIPAGLLAERVGAPRLLVLGTLVAGSAFIGLSFADSFVPVLVGFFIAGCGGAVQHPLASTLITSAYRGPARRAALGVYNAFGDVGKFAFMGATVLALGAGLAWQWPMMAFGVVALATGVVVWLGLRGFDPARDRIGSTRADGGPDGGEVRVHDTPAGWGIRSRTGVLALGGIASLDSSCRIAFLTFVAFLMIEKGVTAQWAAVAVLVTLFGGMCGKLACGMLAERVGIVKTIAITESWTAAGIVAVVWLPGYTAFAMLPLLGVALNGTSSVIYGTVSELVDDRRHARAYGVIYTLGSMCGIASPLLFGVVADGWGLRAAVFGTAAAVALTLLMLPMLSRALNDLHHRGPND